MRGPVIGDAFGAASRRCWGGGVTEGVVHQVTERDDGPLADGGRLREVHEHGPACAVHLDGF